MNSKESEYQELFLAEALENFEQLNNLFTVLEKEPKNNKVIDSIFRITHTLKGNAMGMSYDDIAALSHTMEDVMGAVKENALDLTKDLFDALFRANDKLGALIKAVTSGEVVRYQGIKTKLAVMLKNERKDKAPEEPQQAAPEAGAVAQPVAEEAATEVVEEEAQEEESTEEDASGGIAFTEVIQIPVRKMDELMNLVGQLMIERDRIIANTEAQGRSMEFEGLKRITSDLQYSVMKARMVQVGFLFNKFHRIVRDVSAIEGKKINLELKGTDIEIDRNILKIMSDSLVHLVRNAGSHGIEPEDVRLKRGKPAEGTITLNAEYRKDSVMIIISDDGNGIDVSSIRKKIVKRKLLSEVIAKELTEDQVIQYIFQAGFSNSEKVTEVSGRGVGMDVVKRAVDSIGGQITIETELGKGSTFNLLLPSSLALKGVLLFEQKTQVFAIPLSYTEAVISLKKKELHQVGGGLMVDYLKTSISIIFFQDLLNMTSLSEISEKRAMFKGYEALEADATLNVIVVKYSGKMIGIAVEKLLQQKEIIEKVLPRPLNNNKLLSGSAILGDGHLCLVVDVATISDLLFKSIIARE